jgi:hypothetical protein
MPFDSGGNHSLPDGTIVNTGDKILPSQHNPAMQDISASLSSVLVRDGRAGMVGNLPMGGFKVTNMGDGSSASDAATVGQVPAVYGDQIASANDKATPVDADYLPLYDSAASNVLKKLTWANLKTTLSSLFALRTVTVTGGGIATGGGDLTANRTVTVTEASKAQAQAGTASDVAMTPRRVTDAMNANLYSGADASNLNFPIGSYLSVGVDNGAIPARNSTVTVRLSAQTQRYSTVSGTALTGTWKARGDSGNAGGSGDRPVFILCQRVA